MSTTGTPGLPASGFSHFHAIVTAKPDHGSGPQTAPNLQQRRGSYERLEVRFHDGKRKRDISEAGPSTPKTLKRLPEDEGSSKRGPTILYKDRDDLLNALQDRFKQGPHVDFHATYEMLDSELTHKQRIQTITHEIWKTTGYRFTVKDHPQFLNGHKTRFWCSQDDAHRSKSSRAARKAQGTLYTPRVTSAGEIMAKARYPCRSRLLISSRDCEKPGLRVITVRMHHHYAHEPYVDSNLPPEIAQGIWESFGWIGHGELGHPDGKGDVSMMTGPSTTSPQEEEEEESIESDDSDSPLEPFDQLHDTPPGQSDSIPPYNEQAQSNPDIYHTRMTAHIKNLREFCDGLEYQLQFNDYRMLSVLEREGGSFLDLVEDCLRKEGRLVSTERTPLPPPDTNTALNCRVDVPSLARTPLPGRGDNSDNPGINPEALSR
ncbi:hypothetical protein B0H34DRAFT_665852 [Crassisporium funariophilum]|nr:hypothetical protein B0H34DRAFT_665852 [Crassisporium funariophilum]